jgi:hypothetical protein
MAGLRLGAIPVEQGRGSAQHFHLRIERESTIKIDESTSRIAADCSHAEPFAATARLAIQWNVIGHTTGCAKMTGCDAVSVRRHLRYSESAGIHARGLDALMGGLMLTLLSRLSAGASLVALTALWLAGAVPQAHAQDKVLRVGTLKLIHGISAYFYDKFAPPGYTVQVIPFESPTDGKNAVLTGTVDTCIHGIAAFILGAGANEPVVIVANANNGGMAIMAGLDAGGRDSGAAAHGGHVDPRHPADPAAVQRSCRGAGAR